VRAGLGGAEVVALMSLTFPLSTPACRQAPTATTSSGLTPLLGSYPPVSDLTRLTSAGIRVEPPTKTTRRCSLHDPTTWGQLQWKY
jgi:hypothetical protein